jgi:hypothetical protein
VHYADDTFALYEGLFKEAHAAVVKTAGWRDFLARKLSPKLDETILRQDAALQHAAEVAERRAYDEALAAGQKLKDGGGASANEVASANKWRNRALVGGGLGLGVGLPAAYYAGHGQGTADKNRTRNLAFGAGAAAGITAPHLIRGLGQIARGAGQTGLFPDLQGYGGI